MHDHTPRVAAIHDLSGLGRCSLTVALPVLSVMGCQCAPMPTAVLSSQTGGVTGYTFRDMTDQMEPIAAHWKAVDAKFDAIYTGFLGSEAQLSIVERFFDNFAKPDTLLLVDPVMGDDGAAYDTYGDALIAGMRRLADRADIANARVAGCLCLRQRLSGHSSDDRAEEDGYFHPEGYHGYRL